MKIEFDIPTIVNLGDRRYGIESLDVRLRATVAIPGADIPLRLATAKVVYAQYLKHELRHMYHDIIDDAFKKMPKMVMLE